MIPEGTYKCRAEEGALGETSQGHPQMAVLLRLLDGGQGAEGQLITWYGSFTDKSIDRTFETLRHLGWKGDDLSELDGLGSVEASAVIEHQADLGGTPRARVKWVNSGGGLALKTRMDPGDAKAFAQRMRGHVLAHGQRQGAPTGTNTTAPKRGAPATHAVEPGDDIPF